MAHNHELMTGFLQAYERHVKEVLRPTRREVRRILERWQKPDHWVKYKRTNRLPIPTPVEKAITRIKRPEQVVDKIFRKRDKFPDGLDPASFLKMHDAVGVRVVVYFLSHLPLIDRELRGSELLEISSDEPPTAYMSADQVNVLGLNHLRQAEKESGYSSVHYTLRLRNSGLPEERRPWFELQVQTVTQELWSTMEHHLGYKPGTPTNVAAQRQFKILSKMLGAVDDHFNFLYEEMNRFQEEVAYADTDALTVESLPPVLADHGISCAQRDINNILKFLYSRGVETVHDLQEVATPKRLAIIRHTYLSLTGRLPANLEVVATLAALRGAPDEPAEIETIKSQIAFRGAWDSIRDDFGSV